MLSSVDNLAVDEEKTYVDEDYSRARREKM